MEAQSKGSNGGMKVGRIFPKKSPYIRVRYCNPTYLHRGILTLNPKP